MAHELTMRGNTAEMAYVGKTPWHGLGQQMQAGATIEEWLIAAGMDWRIERAKVRYATASGQGAESWSTVGGKVVLLRSDTKADLSIVSDSYKRVQPRDVAEFFRDIADENHGSIETMGTLFGGRRFWAMARLSEGAVIADPRDKIRPYLMLTTSCDGTLPTTAKYLYTQVVCNNTLTAGLGETGSTTVKVKHKTTFDPTDVKAKLGIGNPVESFDSFIQSMRDLAATAMSKETMVTNTVELFKPGLLASGDAEQLDKAIRGKTISRVLELAIRGNGNLHAGIEGASGTAYGWLNAITQYVDHEGREHTQDARLDSAWFGKGNDTKSQAFGMAQAVSARTQTAPGMLADALQTTTQDGEDVFASLLRGPARI